MIPRGRSLFALAFLVMLAIWSPPVALKLGKGSARNLAARFPAKRLFVEIDGGMRRLAGRRICNNRIVLKNGHVGFMKYKVGDTDGALERETAFAGLLASRNIPFIHVQAPMGVDLPRTLLREVCECNGNEMAGTYCERLRGRGVQVLDLRERFAGTAADVSRYFLRADHHWNYDAAFIACEMMATSIVQRLNLRVPDGNDILKRDEWRIRRLRLWRSGSHAKRTGTLFSGMEDLEYREPAGKTRVRRAIYDAGWKPHVKEGDFRDVFVAKGVVGRRNWHAKGAYSVFPHVNFQGVFSNRSAPLPKRVVVLGDSFARPVPAYLVKVFREVVIMDPRHFPLCKMAESESLAEHVLALKPDIVIQLMNPSSFNVDFGDAGLGRMPATMFDYGIP